MAPGIKPSTALAIAALPLLAELATAFCPARVAVAFSKSCARPVAGGRQVPCMLAENKMHSGQSQGRRAALGSLLPAAFAALTLAQTAIAKGGPGNGERVLVIGATSTMGQETCKDLLASGFQVRGFTRRAEDVQKAVVGTEYAAVEWVNGDLKELTGLDTAMKGVKKVVFAPLLATRAGSDPEYFKQAVDQDIQMNRLVFAEGA